MGSHALDMLDSTTSTLLLEQAIEDCDLNSVQKAINGGAEVNGGLVSPLGCAAKMGNIGKK